MKKLIKSLIPPRIWAATREFILNIFDGYATKSYSQEGEDMILRRLFDYSEQGFYVDIGAHHPKRFSNTHCFYKIGWRGINIDALPGTKKLFDKERPRDINIEMGVSLQKGEMIYYIFDDPALNSFDEKLSLERINTTDYKLLKKEKRPVDTLESILKTYLPQNTKIDFMSIDVEGLDLEVLKSNDWEIFRPKYLLVESLNSDMSEIAKCPIYLFLSSVDYKPFAKTVNTYIYQCLNKESK